MSAAKGIKFFQAVYQSQARADAGIALRRRPCSSFGNPPLRAIHDLQPLLRTGLAVRVLVLQDEPASSGPPRRRRVSRSAHNTPRPGIRSSRWPRFVESITVDDQFALIIMATSFDRSSSAVARRAVPGGRLCRCGMKTALIEREHPGGTCAKKKRERRLHSRRKRWNRQRARRRMWRPRRALRNVATGDGLHGRRQTRKDRIVHPFLDSLAQVACMKREPASDRGHARHRAATRSKSRLRSTNAEDLLNAVAAPCARLAGPARRAVRDQHHDMGWTPLPGPPNKTSCDTGENYIGLEFAQIDRRFGSKVTVESSKATVDRARGSRCLAQVQAIL